MLCDIGYASNKQGSQRKTMNILKFLAFLFFLVIVAGIIVLYEGDIPKDVVDARYSNPSSQFLDLGDAGRIHYRDDGNRRSPALLLIHGSSASLHTFEPWVERLSAEFRVITLDLPGHGLTGEVPSGDYSTESFIKVVNALTAHLSLNEFVLGGNSMGGRVAWNYAIEYPDQLRGLILIDASGPAAWSEAGQDRNSAVLIFDLLRKPWFRAIATKLDPYYVTQQGVRAAYNNASIVDENLIMRYYDLNMRAGTRKATIDRFQQYDPRGARNPSDVTTPTLIMWGEEDVLTPFGLARKFESAIADHRTAYYAGIGHIPMEETPDQSAEDIAEFMREVNR